MAEVIDSSVAALFTQNLCLLLHRRSPSFLLQSSIMIHFSAEAFMELGLDLSGYKDWRQCNYATNLDRFKARFGSTPQTCEDMWSDLQTSTDMNIQINNRVAKRPTLLLLCIRFLWKYGTEQDLCSEFGMSENTVAKWTGFMTLKLSHLLSHKVSSIYAVLLAFSINT